MSNEGLFNKKQFANLLDMAKGDRSINQYANETGVSAAHISRFLRQMIDSPPTPETISKFADKAHNSVTYKEMMIAAGYIAGDNKVEVEEYSPRSRREEIQRIEQEIFQIIISDLMNRDFKWYMEKPEGRPMFPDLKINLEDGHYEKWYFEFRAVREGNMPFFLIHHFYGRLLTFELTPSDKFTLVVNDEKTFDFILRRPPVNLRANLYIMLVDLKSKKVIKEEKVCDYFDGVIKVKDEEL